MELMKMMCTPALSSPSHPLLPLTEKLGITGKPGNNTFMDKLTTRRNKHTATRSNQNIDKRAAFIAIGILHRDGQERVTNA
jgi:uncharacterized protein YbaP (TraB family)